MLIEGWLGVELAVVRGPATTSTAETEQSFAIPQLKGQRGSRGRESEVLLAREGSEVVLVGRGEEGWPHTCPWPWG